MTQVGVQVTECDCEQQKNEQFPSILNVRDRDWEYRWHNQKIKGCTADKSCQDSSSKAARVYEIEDKKEVKQEYSSKLKMNMKSKNEAG